MPTQTTPSDVERAEPSHSAAATVLEALERVISKHGDRIAITDTVRQLSYRDLWAQSGELAMRLVSAGVMSGDRVGILLPRSAAVIVSIVAIWRAGAAYVPIDPEYPAQRIGFMISDAQLRTVIVDQTTAAHAAVSDVVSLPLEGSTPTVLSDELPQAPAPQSTAYLIYTSGSTGRPKAVEITHANLARLFASATPYFQFGAEDVFSLFHSFSFDVSVWEIWAALIHAARLVVVDFATSRDPRALARLFEHERVSVASQTPSAFYPVAELDAREPRNFALRYLIFAGEALDVPRLRPWLERHGENRPELINMYGPTEATVYATYRRIRLADCSNPESVIGHPLPDLEFLLADEHGAVLSGQAEAEAWIVGPGLARGYWNRPDLTAERFPTLPDGRRAYRTGDRMRRLDNGELVFLGRLDHQIKLRGYRIELGEIEA